MSFSTHPDREAAQREALERRRRVNARAHAELQAELCAEELAACVALGLSWPEIAPRLRRLCEPGW